jgi:hypothetical protein
LGAHLVDPVIDADLLPSNVTLKNNGIEELKPLSEE